jgi:hypothetical protein
MISCFFLIFTELKSLFSNEYLVIEFAIILSCIACIISSLESISLITHYKEGGIFSWKVRSVRTTFILMNPVRKLFDWIFRYPNVIFVYLIRLLFSIIIIFSTNSVLLLCLECASIAILSIILSIRGSDGSSGADQMYKMTFFACALILASSEQWVWQCGIIFLTGLLVLSYSTSGWLRIFEPTWRDGSALLIVLRQNTYGNRRVWELARKHPTLNRIASMAALLFECSFCLALFLPFHFLLIYLFFGIIFHAFNAWVMGLNTFFWAFIAIYPPFIWLSLKIHSI